MAFALTGKNPFPMVAWFENSEGRLSGSYWLRLEGWGVKRNWTDGQERKLKRTQEGQGKESIKNKEIITNSTEGITYILKNVLKQPMSKERLDNSLQSTHRGKQQRGTLSPLMRSARKLGEERAGSQCGETHAFSELEPEPWTWSSAALRINSLFSVIAPLHCFKSWLCVRTEFMLSNSRWGVRRAVLEGTGKQETDHSWAVAVGGGTESRDKMGAGEVQWGVHCCGLVCWEGLPYLPNHDSYVLHAKIFVGPRGCREICQKEKWKWFPSGKNKWNNLFKLPSLLKMN